MENELVELLERYDIPASYVGVSPVDGEVSANGPLSDGKEYHLCIDPLGFWELYDGRRRRSGETNPKFAVDAAFSHLLCLYGIRER